MIYSEFDKNKEIIINTLNHSIDKNKNILKHFGLSEENFSKTLISELKIFTKELKFNKDIFTQTENENLIFVKKECLNKDNYESEINTKIINENRLDLLKTIISNLNYKLKIQKEKFMQKNLINENNLKIDYKSKDNTSQYLKNKYEFTINKIKQIFIDKRKDKLKNESTYGKIEVKEFEKIKQEIIDLKNKNMKLKNEKSEVENKINKFINLPSDINKIKDMIKMKNQEFTNLKDLNN